MIRLIVSVIKVFRKNEDDILFKMTPDCIIYRFTSYLSSFFLEKSVV